MFAVLLRDYFSYRRSKGWALRVKIRLNSCSTIAVILIKSYQCLYLFECVQDHLAPFASISDRILTSPHLFTLPLNQTHH